LKSQGRFCIIINFEILCWNFVFNLLFKFYHYKIDFRDFSDAFRSSNDELEEIRYPVSTLAQDLKDLLDSKLLADVTITTNEGSTFSAHKAILAARCGVFSLHFMSAAAAKKKDKKDSVASNVTLDADVPKPVFDKLLDFVYTDEVNFTSGGTVFLFNVFLLAYTHLIF
jgi:hypothetical protein